MFLITLCFVVTLVPLRETKKMKKILTILFAVSIAVAQSQTLSEKVAATTMNLWKDSFSLDGKPAKWTYDMGVIFEVDGRFVV